MPTWRNNTSKIIVVGNQRVEPGESVTTYAYYDTAVTGATKTADTPYYNPIIASGRITTDSTITVPSTDAQGNYVSRYQIHMYCGTGTGAYATVTFNNIANTPALVIAGGRSWNIRCMERMYETINVALTVASEFFYTIELV